jgi:hypothetical protein
LDWKIYNSGGILAENLPGMLRDTLPRRNGVSFSAQKGKLQPPAREIAAQYAPNAAWHRSAREWGIFFCAKGKL